MDAIGPDRPAAEVPRAACARYGDDPAALIEILHDLQEELGYVPEDALPVIAEALNLSRAEIHGVVSFYHDFRRSPAGRVVVRVCRAESCQAMGANALIDQLCRRHGLGLGETSPDGALTIEAVYCLGNCGLSPAAMVNGRLLGRLDADRMGAAIAEAGA